MPTIYIIYNDCGACSGTGVSKVGEGNGEDPCPYCDGKGGIRVGWMEEVDE